MKSTTWTRCARGLTLLLLALLAPQHCCFAQGTAFTYQGRLTANAAPANGLYDLTFELYYTNATGFPIAGPVTNSAVNVTNGLFTVAIDLGYNAIAGGGSWLEIAVRTNGSGAFVTVSPRQAVRPVPLSVWSAGAGSVSASNVTGVLGMSSLPGSVVTNGANGLSIGGVFNGTLVGNGAGITNMSAANVVGNASSAASGIMTSNVFLEASVEPFTTGPWPTKPPKGLGFWYSPFNTIAMNENIVFPVIDMLAKSYSRPPLNYIQIDDGEFDHRDANGNLQLRTNSWPSGLAGLILKCHTNGIYLGVYTEPNEITEAGAPGSAGHIEQDARYFADMGVDYVKWDESLFGRTYQEALDLTRQFVTAYRAEAKNRPVFVQIDLGTGIGSITPEWMELGNWVRENGDFCCWATTNAQWAEFLTYVDSATANSYLMRQGHYLSFDEDARLISPDPEDKKDSMNGPPLLFQAPYFVGNENPPGVVPWNDRFMANPYVWMIEDDPLFYPPLVVSSNANSEVLVKRLVNGATAVSLINRSLVNATAIGFSWSDVLFPPNASLNILNVFWESNIVTASSSGSYSITLPAESALTYIVSLNNQTNLSANQVWTGSNTFAGPLVAGGLSSSNLVVTGSGGITNFSLAGGNGFLTVDANGREILSTNASALSGFTPSQIAGALGFTPQTNTPAAISNVIGRIGAPDRGQFLSFNGSGIVWSNVPASAARSLIAVSNGAPDDRDARIQALESRVEKLERALQQQNGVQKQ